MAADILPDYDADPDACPFLTPDEDARLRRLTWLLANPAFTRVPPTALDQEFIQRNRTGRFRRLKSLAMLLVRQHEVVAAMPACNGTEVVVSGEFTEVGDSDWVIARNHRWSQDSKGEWPHSVRTDMTTISAAISAQTLTTYINHPPTSFKEHAYTVISLLKMHAAATYSLDGTIGNWSADHLYDNLQVYILRACLQKVAARAALHCKMIAQQIDRSDTKAKAAKKWKKRDNYAVFLPSPSSWFVEKTSECDQLFQGVDFKAIFRKQLDEHVAATSGADTHRDENHDAWWGSKNGIVGEFLDDLEAHDLNSGMKLLCPELERGFYLTADGRKKYHRVFTTTLASSLFYLRLLVEQSQNCAEGQGHDEDFLRLVSECLTSLTRLQIIAFESPILAMHLQWYLSPNTTVQGGTSASVVLGHEGSKNVNDDTQMDVGSDDNTQQKEDEGESEDEGEGEDVKEDEKEQEELDETVWPGKAPASFKVEDGVATYIVRWLRLLTEHLRSIEILANSRNARLMMALKVHILRTELLKNDRDLDLNPPFGMQSIRECLVEYIQDEINLDLLTNELERSPATFNGAYHCEAILGSLYLLAKSSQIHDGVTGPTAVIAGKLWPQLCAVSKKCCPVCTIMYKTISGVASAQITLTGIHQTFSACRLPPWLPRTYAMNVMKNLEICLKNAIDVKIKELQQMRQPSCTSSPEPGTSEPEEETPEKQRRKRTITSRRIATLYS